jgi:hypothetical protein
MSGAVGKVTFKRLNLLDEGLIWTMALDHFGPDQLEKIAVQLLQDFGPLPKRGLAEALRKECVGEGILQILRKAL